MGTLDFVFFDLWQMTLNLESVTLDVIFLPVMINIWVNIRWKFMLSSKYKQKCVTASIDRRALSVEEVNSIFLCFLRLKHSFCYVSPEFSIDLVVESVVFFTNIWVNFLWEPFTHGYVIWNLVNSFWHHDPKWQQVECEWSYYESHRR